MPRLRKGLMSQPTKLAADLFFESNLPSEADLINAARDPLAAAREESDGGPRLARDMQKDAVTLAQAVNVIATERNFAGQSSLGDGALKSIGRLVASEVYKRDIRLSQVLGQGASLFDSIIGDALGSVPFVGIAASAIVVAVELAGLFNGSGYREGRAPLYQMSPRKDTDDTVAALHMLAEEGNWTRLFMPRTIDSLFADGESSALPGQSDGAWSPSCMPWPVSEEQIASDGMSFNRLPYVEQPKRFGCAPGSLSYVDDGVQSRITESDVTVPRTKKPSYLDALNAGKNLQALTDLTFPRGEWLPSLAALGRAVWSMLGTHTGSTMFQVNASKVERAWQSWHDSMVAWRCFLVELHGQDLRAKLPPGMGKEQARAHISVWLARMGAAQHDRSVLTLADALGEADRYQRMRVLLTGRAPERGRSIGKHAVEHAADLAKRQRAACSTVLAALVSRDAPAFRGADNKALREHLGRERAAQLEAGRFDHVELADVPDRELRDRIRSRAQALGRTDAEAAERARTKRELEAYVMRTQIPRPKRIGGDEPTRVGGGSGDGGGGAGLLALLGAGALGAYMLKR